MKIISLITIEVHARDIVAKLVEDKAESVEGFSWLSQLRYYWDPAKRECFARLVDAEFVYPKKTNTRKGGGRCDLCASPYGAPSCALSRAHSRRALPLRAPSCPCRSPCAPP